MPRLALPILSCLLALAPAGATMRQNTAPARPDLEALVARLGDRDPAVREQATLQLWEIGASATAALDEAAKSRQPEVAARARLLLERLALGLEPDTPADVVNTAVQARSAAEGAERAAARQRLATTASAGAASVISRLIADTAAGKSDAGGDGEPRDPAEQVYRELWPQDRWGLACVVDELMSRGERAALLAWLESAAASGAAMTAGPHLAYLLKVTGGLEEAQARWAERARVEPGDAIHRTLACLRYAGGDTRGAAEALAAASADSTLPVVLSLLEDDLAQASALAGAHPEQATRLSMALVLARLREDAAAEQAAEQALRQWLEANAEAALGGVAAAADEPGADSIAAARRALLAALLVADFDSAFALADATEAAGLLRVLYRRLEFDAAQETYQRHARRDDRQFRSVRSSHARMIAELRPQSRASETDPQLSPYARRRLEAGTDLRRGNAASAAEAFEALAALDPCDPAILWALAASMKAAGREADAAPLMARALLMPLADAWVRRGLAEEIWLNGPREEALLQFQEAGRWASFVPIDALPALEAWSDRLGEAGRHADARRVVAAALVLLFSDEYYEHLEGMDRGIYYACYLASQLERARMNVDLGEQRWLQAQAAWRRSLAYMPQSEATIDFITTLDAAGQKSMADKAFVEAFTTLQLAVTRYRQSSMLNNQAAWLAARSERRLDTALDMARAAVACDPSSAAAIDTLIEVHLRRGETAQAAGVLERLLPLAEQSDASTGIPLGQFNDYVARHEQFLRRLEAGGARGERQ